VPPASVSEEVATSTSTDILYPKKLGGKVASAVVLLANRLDSFFGTTRSDDENNGSTLRLIPSYTFYSHQKGNFELGLNLNLKLRNLENKAKAIEETVREGVLETTGLTESGKSQKESSVNDPHEEKDPWRTNFESKLAFRPAPFYSGLFRIRKNFDFDLLINRFAFSIGWDSQDQFIQLFQFTTDSLVIDDWLFRLQNDSKWFITRGRFVTDHGPIFIQTVNKYNSVSYKMNWSFLNDNENFHHTETRYSIQWRNSSPSKTVFIDIIPAYTYPIDNDFKEIRSLELRLEYFFGAVK
jgi:hypothetical protein